ncbi:hypothetical protein PUN28_007692 [Cardiocondyla obscurior]|uniref:Uncharacterized protein n=1 Tax=Cardiocondyla obscurior TaxID=286306 RepID=A0AAW2FVM0_9HYME
MNASINAVSPLVNILRKIFYVYFIRLWKINCFLECPVGFFNKFKPSFLFPQSAKTVHQRKLIFIKVLKVTGKRYVTAANQRDHPEFRGSRRSLSDHSWCKRKIFVPSTPDSTDTLQSEFRFGALGTKGSRRKLTKETVRRPGEAAEVPLTIPGTRENSSTYPVLQIALTLCRVWRFGDERFATKTNQGNRPETREAAEVSLTIPGARENSSTYPVLQIALTLCRVWRFGDERFATKTNQGNRPETREAAEVSLTIPGARENSSTYPVLQIALTLCRVNSGLALWGRKVRDETNQGNRPETREAAEVPLTIPGTRENSSTYPVLQIALTLCRVWRFGDERFATKTNQGNRPETREAAEVFLTIPGARENSSTYPVLQIALTLCRVWRFGDERFATKTNQGNRPETREAAEVSLTIPGARENSSTYPVLQIALTLCRVWRFGDERFATKTNQGNRPETREAAEVPLTIPGTRENSSTYPVLQIALTLCRVNSGMFGALGTKGSRRKLTKETVRRPGKPQSLSDHSWCKRKFLDLPSTPDSTNTLQSEFRFGALGTKGSRRKLTKETVRRPGKPQKSF